MHRNGNEQGSTLPFIALAIVMVGLTVILLGRVGGAPAARPTPPR